MSDTPVLTTDITPEQPAPETDDVLTMLDEMNAEGRIEYSDYVSLHNAATGRATQSVPEASREDVTEVLRSFLPLTPEPALDSTAAAQAAALLARFVITERGER